MFPLESWILSGFTLHLGFMLKLLTTCYTNDLSAIGRFGCRKELSLNPLLELEGRHCLLYWDCVLENVTSQRHYIVARIRPLQ